MTQAEDDQRWLDNLAGRSPPGGDPATAREAGLLREALLAQAARDTTPVPGPDAAREARLIARAREAGLLPPEPAGHGARRGWREWFAGRRTGFAFALAACLVLAVGIAIRPQHEPETTVRSGPEGIVRLSVPDPAAEKRAIIDELRAAGVDATGYERLGAQGIDADLPQPLTAEVTAVLHRHRITPPADGVLRVEIEQAR